MAGGAGQGSGGIISGINVTPLVDITLVLLIIFIVTAKLIVTPAVPLDLPKASQSQELQVIFSVVVPASGAMRVNGVIVTSDAALLSRARQALADHRNLRAVIDADGRVEHRQVVHVLDLLRRAGLSKVAFGALPEDEKAPE